MNWLAHLYLSEPDPRFRIGNLLPDLVRGHLLAALPAEFQRGIVRHRRIDAFTDAHPDFRRSVQRLQPPFRRFGPIVCDVFYDHFLASEWESYSPQGLASFVHDFYDSIDSHRGVIPGEAYAQLERIRAGDWLCSYRDITAVSRALDGIGFRFSRPVRLSPALGFLERDYDGFRSDFHAFFARIRSHFEAAGLRDNTQVS